MDLLPNITTDFIEEVNGETSEEEIIEEVKRETKPKPKPETIFEPVIRKVKETPKEPEPEPEPETNIEVNSDVNANGTESERPPTPEPSRPPTPESRPPTPKKIDRRRGKKVCTDKQREHLAKARAKGLETRKRNAELKKKRAQEERDNPPQTPKPRKDITEEDLERITYNAIQKHEEQRKQRKANKKQSKIDAHEEQVRNKVYQAVHRQAPSNNDIWASAFF